MKLGPFEIPANWPRVHRNARGMAAGLVLFAAIATMQWLRCNPVQHRDTVFGEVVEVEATGLRPFGDGQVLSRVRLALPDPDSTTVRLLLPPPVPEPGALVPLLRETHANGESLYTLDRPRWQTEGPASRD